MMESNDTEKVEMQGIVFCEKGRIKVGDTSDSMISIETFIAQALGAPTDYWGNVIKNGPLGRAKIIIEVLE